MKHRRADNHKIVTRMNMLHLNWVLWRRRRPSSSIPTLEGSQWLPYPTIRCQCTQCQQDRQFHARDSWLLMVTPHRQKLEHRPDQDRKTPKCSAGPVSSSGKNWADTARSLQAVSQSNDLVLNTVRCLQSWSVPDSQQAYWRAWAPCLTRWRCSTCLCLQF